jgi:hypothetical protein
MEDLGFEGSPDIAHSNGEFGTVPDCAWWWWETAEAPAGDCLVTHCYQESPGDPDPTSRSLTEGQVYELYLPIKNRCEPLRAGGEFTGSFEFVSQSSWLQCI